MKYLIVGLGNIGAEYENTRHNIGFTILDALAKASNICFESSRYASIAEVKFKGRTLVLVKPSTYMNLSGKAVSYWMQQNTIPIDNILVLVDDLAIPFGKIRIRAKGSDGGHNGLKDIQARLNTTDYARLRFGIGDEFHKGQQVDYVLGKWSAEEIKALEPRIDVCIQAIKSFTTIGLPRTMSEFNSK